jgi:hypothetical protein
MDWSRFKARCSALSMIMSESKANPCLTEKQAIELAELEAKATRTANQEIRITELRTKQENSKKTILSDSCISALTEAYALQVHGTQSITKELDIATFRKGRLCEPEALNMLSFVDNVIYEKNEDRVENEFISGHPDVFVGPEIMQATSIIDGKVIWDHPGFLSKMQTPLNSANQWQVGGYMWITGAKTGYIANVLVSMPPEMVNDYLRKILYQMGVATDENPEYKKRVASLMKSMVFDNIPIQQRVHKRPVEPLTEFEKNAVGDRVKQCRDWLNNFHEWYIKLNK